MKFVKKMIFAAIFASLLLSATAVKHDRKSSINATMVADGSVTPEDLDGESSHPIITPKFIHNTKAA